MKTFLQTIGVFGALGAFAMLIASVWVGDWKWLVTGLLTLVMTYGTFVWASNAPRHEDVCGGC
jgi:hypothetical protein